MEPLTAIEGQAGLARRLRQVLARTARASGGAAGPGRRHRPRRRRGQRAVAQNARRRA